MNKYALETITVACYENPFVPYEEAIRMWEVCEKYAETLYGVPLSKTPYGGGYSTRALRFHQAMKDMNNIRERRYKEANGLLPLWEPNISEDDLLDDE